MISLNAKHLLIKSKLYHLEGIYHQIIEDIKNKLLSIPISKTSKSTRMEVSKINLQISILVCRTMNNKLFMTLTMVFLDINKWKWQVFQIVILNVRDWKQRSMRNIVKCWMKYLSRIMSTNDTIFLFINIIKLIVFLMANKYC